MEIMKSTESVVRCNIIVLNLEDVEQWQASVKMSEEEWLLHIKPTIYLLATAGGFKVPLIHWPVTRQTIY